MSAPLRHARRQLLRDRFTELLEGWGSPHAEHRAGQLLDAVDDLGFTLPPAIDDPPPAPSYSTKAGRARARAIYEQTREQKQATATEGPTQ